MKSIHDYRIDTTESLFSPSIEDLKRRIERLQPGLWKIGACYQDRLDSRPYDAKHYDDQYFNRDGSVCLAWGIHDAQQSNVLETAAIQYAKLKLFIGVNSKNSDSVPHDGYSPERPGALYAVPVQPHIKTQQQFFNVHASYHMRSNEERYGTKEEREAAKRAKLLDALMRKIPKEELEHAFEPASGADRLVKLQRTYGFRESNTKVYKDLRALFLRTPAGSEVWYAKNQPPMRKQKKNLDAAAFAKFREVFQETMNPSKEKKKELAREFNLPIRKVGNWFGSQRFKVKNQPPMRKQQKSRSNLDAAAVATFREVFQKNDNPSMEKRLELAKEFNLPILKCDCHGSIVDERDFHHRAKHAIFDFVCLIGSSHFLHIN